MSDAHKAGGSEWALWTGWTFNHKWEPRFGHHRWGSVTKKKWSMVWSTLYYKPIVLGEGLYSLEKPLSEKQSYQVGWRVLSL